MSKRLYQLTNYQEAKLKAIEVGGELTERFLSVVERDNDEEILNKVHHYVPYEATSTVRIDDHGVVAVGQGTVADYKPLHLDFERGIGLVTRKIDIFRYNGQYYAARLEDTGQ